LVPVKNNGIRHWYW